MASATDVTVRGALCTEAALLRSRVLAIRGLVRTLLDLVEASAVDAVTRLRPFINHLAARGRAEEHILYPYAESSSATGLTSLRRDHVRLEGLATAIAAWTPAMGRAKLALLLTAFCETAEAHLDLETNRCLTVVHEHTSARTERYLFGEVEIETFETVRQ
jgi:hemerythrin-like domain-containing protein